MSEGLDVSLTVGYVLYLFDVLWDLCFKTNERTLVLPRSRKSTNEWMKSRFRLSAAAPIDGWHQRTKPPPFVRTLSIDAPSRASIEWGRIVAEQQSIRNSTDGTEMARDQDEKEAWKTRKLKEEALGRDFVATCAIGRDRLGRSELRKSVWRFGPDHFVNLCGQLRPGSLPSSFL